MQAIGTGILVTTLTLVISTAVLGESDLLTLPREVLGESARTTDLEPWISESLPARMQRALPKAFELATDRLRNQSECQGLFDDLGADGLEVLAKALYYGVALRQEQTICRRASAFTNVGGRVTRLCSSFSRLRGNQAAIILIHEALHQAGLSEKPVDPQGLESAQINRLVRNRCGL